MIIENLTSTFYLSTERNPLKVTIEPQEARRIFIQQLSLELVE